VVQRTIVQQFNPERPALGGVDSVIRDVIKFSPPEDRWAIVGVQAPELGRRGLGRWREAEVGGRPVDFLPVAALDPADQRRRVPHTVRLVGGLLRAGRPALRGTLHVHRVDVAAAMAALYPSTRPVLWIHNTTVSALGANSDSVWRHVAAVYAPTEVAAIRRAEAIVAAGKLELVRVAALHDVCHELPAWYDDELFTPVEHAPNDPLVIGWAGRLEAPKDPLLALEVMAELRRRDVDAVLEMHGAGTLGPAVERAVADRGLGDVVRLRGTSPREELGAHLGCADVVMMTSHYEGSPRVLVEALACGTPVACPAVADPAGVLNGTNGCIAVDRSAAAIADAVSAAAGLCRADAASSVAAGSARLTVPSLLAALGDRAGTDIAEDVA
jgi:glycosyltransferase involved in cell wall biosynthesis